MIKEASGPINFTVFLTMFGEKLKGEAPPPRRDVIVTSSWCVMTSLPVCLTPIGADPEDVIMGAFKVLDPDGKGSIKKSL